MDSGGNMGKGRREKRMDKTGSIGKGTDPHPLDFTIWIRFLSLMLSVVDTVNRSLLFYRVFSTLYFFCWIDVGVKRAIGSPIPKCLFLKE